MHRCKIDLKKMTKNNSPIPPPPPPLSPQMADTWWDFPPTFAWIEIMFVFHVFRSHRSSGAIKTPIPIVSVHFKKTIEQILKSEVSSSNVSLSPGLSKGVGFVRFDQRQEAERAIKHLHNTIPDGYAEPITVKFANNPSTNAKALAPALAAYLSPQRRFPGPIHHPSNRFRYLHPSISPLSRYESD